LISGDLYDGDKSGALKNRRLSSCADSTVWAQAGVRFLFKGKTTMREKPIAGEI